MVSRVGFVCLVGVFVACGGNGNGGGDAMTACDEDADGDLVCDADDVCPGFSDRDDPDADGVPYGCDRCQGSDDAVDADADGAPDGCDVCPGSDDNLDTDGDGVAEGCDACPAVTPFLVVDSTFDGTPGGWEPRTAMSGGSAVLWNNVNLGLFQDVCAPLNETIPRRATFAVACEGAGCRGEISVLIDEESVGSLDTPNTDADELCLGARWYGGERRIRFSAAPSPIGMTSSIGISAMAIAEAPLDCPAIGAVANGAFDAGAAGWTGEGIVVTSNGDAMLELDASSTGCNADEARGHASIPADLPNPAVRFRWSGTFAVPSRLEMRVDLPRQLSLAVHRLTVAPAAGTEETVDICLDHRALGHAVYIDASLTHPNGLCASSGTRVARLDDFEVVSSPDCP
jgi:hypothetical protein